MTARPGHRHLPASLKAQVYVGIMPALKAEAAEGFTRYLARGL